MPCGTRLSRSPGGQRGFHIARQRPDMMHLRVRHPCPVAPSAVEGRRSDGPHRPSCRPLWRSGFRRPLPAVSAQGRATGGSLRRMRTTGTRRLPTHPNPTTRHKEAAVIRGCRVVPAATAGDVAGFAVARTRRLRPSIYRYDWRIPEEFQAPRRWRQRLPTSERVHSAAKRKEIVVWLIPIPHGEEPHGDPTRGHLVPHCHRPKSPSPHGPQYLAPFPPPHRHLYSGKRWQRTGLPTTSDATGVGGS